MERNQLSDGHSQTRGDGERELSGHIIEADYQVVLTSWRTQIEGLVRTQKERKKERKLARDTHFLESTEGRSNQNT